MKKLNRLLFTPIIILSLFVANVSYAHTGHAHQPKAQDPNVVKAIREQQVGNFPLEENATGADVSAAQKILYTKGYLKVPATGFFGPMTKAGILKFQRENNIPASGTLNDHTFDALMRMNTAKSYRVTAAQFQTDKLITSVQLMLAALTTVPNLSFTSTATQVETGKSITLSWVAINATSCKASGSWSGNLSTSGVKDVTQSVAGTYTYDLSCKAGNRPVRKSIVVNVISPSTSTSTPATAPTLTLSANPTSVTSGGSATLTWSSTNSTNCTASGFSGTGTSGSVSVIPAQTTTYSMTCTGAGGSATQQVTVTTQTTTPTPTPAPTLTLSATPSTVTSGSGTTLTWTSTNATACTGTGLSFSGSQPIQGTVTVANITANQTFSLSCTGAGGSVTKSAAVTLQTVTTPTPSGKVVLMSEGDSISVFWGGNHTGIYAATRPDQTHIGRAVGGSAVQNNNGISLVERFDADMALKPTHMTVLIGANDMTNWMDASDPNSQPTAWLNSLWSYTDKVRAQGIKVAVGTMLPQCYPTNQAYNDSFSRRRAIVNPAIRAAVGTHIDGVIDFAADGTIGDDADACDTNKYSDGVHPSFTGQQRMAVIYGAAVDTLVSSSGSTPPPTTSPIPPVTLTERGATMSVTVTLPAYVLPGSDATFTWRSTGATKCSVWGWGPFPTDMGLTGSVTIPNITQSTVALVKCDDASGIPLYGTLNVMPSALANTPLPPLLNEPDSIASNFNINSELVPAWGTGGIPVSMAPDTVGAFRFSCAPSHLGYNDPIVYPGQSGKSHLHQFFGNTLTNAYSTYESLRTTGTSTCNNALNRSGYWIPAMINGADKVVKPDYVSIYYKRRPMSDSFCQKGSIACVNLPRGLRFVFGFSMTNPNATPTGAGYFNCDGPTASSSHSSTIAEAVKNKKCPSAPYTDPNTGLVSYNRLGAVISAPDCWDGKNLDSTDHRSHMAYSSYEGGFGYAKCPGTHPYTIPTFTLGSWYTVDSTLDASATWTPGGKSWYLSSDKMADGTMMTPGTSLHADWFGAWDDTVKKTWEDNCLNKLLSGSGGDLCNGTQLKMFSGFKWLTDPRVVDIPPKP